MFKTLMYFSDPATLRWLGHTAVAGGLCGEWELGVRSETHRLTAEPRQHLPPDTDVDLWSESADGCGCNILGSAQVCTIEPLL